MRLKHAALLLSLGLLAVPDAVYVELPEVGHLIPWEAPDRTAALMREFLASARVGTG